MSADNQVEPVTALSAAAAAAAAAAASSSASSASSASVAASGAASEYLKRTCLICGCQTNQTINIYEPRSGPNIVQLIQAKFKFQPLNEDKFLCFSCNNWLINWHSLQALNSNDTEESQSRSQSPSHMGNSSSSGCLVQQKGQPMERARLRPVAQVRPQPQALPVSPSLPATPIAQPAPIISYNKRGFGRRTAAAGRGIRKMLRHCSVCGEAMVLRLLTTTPAQTLAKLARRSVRSRCRSCRESEISKWRLLHKRSQAKLLQLQRALKQKPATVKPLQPIPTPTQPQYQRFQAPRVDGKVVAMFRRLGTTLSTENLQQQQQQQEPLPSKRPLRIMSPAKQRPRWTRTLDDDEILLEFDSVISEVLPATPAPLATTARRRLCYQLTEEPEVEVEGEVESETEAETECETDEEVEMEVEVTKENRKNVLKLSHQNQLMNLAGLQLPQGLSITLI